MKQDHSIKIKNASLSYNGIVLFKDLEFTLLKKKFTCLLGPSGVGKTTLLKIIANLIHTDKSTYFTGEISSRPDIAYMTQTAALLPWLTAFNNTLIGYQLRGKKTKNIINQANILFEKVGLSQSKNKYPHQLSGGMQQRVSLIRTLLEDKPIVLMDEPFASLDAITRYELQALTVELLKNKTVLLITHDPTEALRIGNEIYVMTGLPASITTKLHLDSPTPRDLMDKDILINHKTLFNALIKVKDAI